MRKWILVTVVTLVMAGIPMCIGLSGCNEPEKVQAFGRQVNSEILPAVDRYEAATAEIVQILADYNVVDANAVAKVNKVLAEMDKVEAEVSDVSAGVSSVVLTGEAVDDWLSMAKTANAVSAPFNPYAGAIAGILAGIGALLPFFRKKSVAASRAITAVGEIVAGVERLKSRDIVSSEDLNSAMSQSLDTEIMVTDVRRDLTV